MLSLRKSLIYGLIPLVLAGFPQKTETQSISPAATQQQTREELEVLVNRYLETFPDFSEIDAFSLASRNVPIEYVLATKDLKFKSWGSDFLDKQVAFNV